MSMSTHVVGFKPPDEKWRQMRDAWRACRAAGIEPPPAVSKFFNHEEPDDAGVEVSEKDLLACGAIVECHPHEMASGFDLHVKKLPADVTIVRFYNSY